MLSFLQSLAVTVFLAFVVRAFVLQPFIVEGASMEPNFHDRQYIIIDKVTFRARPPARGEVIVFHPPVARSQNYIKRIVGLPAERVKVAEGKVFINGTRLDEPYIAGGEGIPPAMAAVETTLGPQEYFVMGDNRGHSSDSREWGKLAQTNIEGRTWLIIYPLKWFSVIRPPAYANSASSPLGSPNPSPL